MSDHRYGDQQAYQHYPGYQPPQGTSSDGPYGTYQPGTHSDSPYARPPQPSAPPYGGHGSGGYPQGGSGSPPQSAEYGYPPAQHQSYPPPAGGYGQHQSAEYGGYPPPPSSAYGQQQSHGYGSTGVHSTAPSSAYGQQQPHGYGVHSTSQSSTTHHSGGGAESVTQTYATGTTQMPGSQKPTKPNDKFGELGALAAGAYSLYKEHKVKTDSSGHKVEESTASHVSTGSGVHSTYEHHEGGTKPEKDKKKPSKGGSLGELGAFAQEAYALYEQHAGGGKTKVEGGHGKQESHGGQGTEYKPEKDKKNKKEKQNSLGELGSLAAEAYAMYDKAHKGKTDSAGGKPSSGGSGQFGDAAKLGKQAFSMYQKINKTNREI